MKKSLISLMLISGITAALPASANEPTVQVEVINSEKTTPTVTESITPAVTERMPQPMTGQFTPADIKDKLVMRASRAAVAQKTTRKHPIKLVKLLNAEWQVVAGQNYKVYLEVKSGKKTRYAEAVVYNNLKNSMKLLSWKWLSNQVGMELKAIPL